jgi:hypothetical protein
MPLIPDIVRPGDIISADLINRIIRQLNEHDALLSQGTGPLNITHVQPTVVRMGEELKVFGSGLDPAGLRRISIEGSDVPLSSLATRTDRLIAFNVPPILGIPDTGRTVVLTIENQGRVSDHESFFLLAGIATNLEASFNITRTAVSPTGTLAANQNYEFTFSIEAYTSRDETYLLEPRLLGAPSDWSVSIRSGVNDLLIRRSQPTPSTTTVVLVVRTGASGGGSLALSLRAQNFAGVTGSSMAEPLSIGATPGEANQDVVFLSPTVQGNVQKYSGGSLYIRIDAIVANQIAVINPLQVRLAQPGIYTIGAPVVSDNRWTVTIQNNPMSFNTTGRPNAIENIIFRVAAQANAPDANVEIPITGADSLPSGSFRFQAKLRSDPSNPTPL